MDTSSPRQDACKQAISTQRLRQRVITIIAVLCIGLVWQYSQRPTFKPIPLPGYIQKQEAKVIINATQQPITTYTQIPISNSPTLKPIKNTVILLWYWPFGEASSLAGNPCNDHYGIPNCDLVTNRSWFSKADLVVLHNRELVNRQQRLPLSLPRPEGQKWVWLSLESPPHNGNMRPLAGHFNYTMSYRRDSDIYTPYGWLVPSKAPNRMTVDDFIPKGKSSLACWVVSNYQARHRRTQVYNKLKTVITVDVYGGATNKRISSKTLFTIISRCYFYLSFENSIATDYITEKLWRNAFIGGAVPVVLGPPRQQYEAVLPNNSFIHVDDFSSVEDLGHFLKTLAEDKERYATYFTWRLNYTIGRFPDWRERLCNICPKVTSLPAQKVYEDLHGWNWQ